MQAWGVYICMYVLKDLWGRCYASHLGLAAAGRAKEVETGRRGPWWIGETGRGEGIGWGESGCDAMRCDGEDLGEGGSGARGRGGGFGKRVTSEGGRDWRACGGEERSV